LTLDQLWSLDQNAGERPGTREIHTSSSRRFLGAALGGGRESLLPANP